MTTPSNTEREIRAFLDHRDPAEQLFGVTLIDFDYAGGRLVMDMPFGALCNPVTQMPCMGLLTVLVDGAGGAINYAYFGGDRWSVTSELSLDVSSRAATILGRDSAGTVRCDARTLSADDTTAIALCVLTVDDAEIGTATVRSYLTPAESRIPPLVPEPLGAADERGVFGPLALTPAPTVGNVHILTAGSDPALLNSVGVVHGGTVSSALEAVAMVAISKGRAGSGADAAAPMTTGSIRVNYLRPMAVGAGARYEGEVVRAGRTIAIADTRAINADGKIAATARITGYAVT